MNVCTHEWRLRIDSERTVFLCEHCALTVLADPAALLELQQERDNLERQLHSVQTLTRKVWRSLYMVLCDEQGHVAISGTQWDRDVVRNSISALKSISVSAGDLPLEARLEQLERVTDYITPHALSRMADQLIVYKTYLEDQQASMTDRVQVDESLATIRAVLEILS